MLPDNVLYTSNHLYPFGYFDITWKRKRQCELNICSLFLWFVHLMFLAFEKFSRYLIKYWLSHTGMFLSKACRYTFSSIWSILHGKQLGNLGKQGLLLLIFLFSNPSLEHYVMVCVFSFPSPIDHKFCFHDFG